MGDDHRVHIPQVGELPDVRRIVPVAEARQVAVGPALAGILRRRLAVHLVDRAAVFAEHPPQEVEVVHRAGRGRGAHRLVKALQNGGDELLARTEDTRRLADVLGGHPADVGGALRRVVHDRRLQLLEVDGVRLDVRVVEPVVDDEFVQ